MAIPEEILEKKGKLEILEIGTELNNPETNKALIQSEKEFELGEIVKKN